MNLIKAIDTEIGTPPQPSFDLDTLIEQGLQRRARAWRIGIGVRAVIAAVVAATIVFFWSASQSTPEPTASPPATSSATPIPLPTRSWPTLPFPTGVPPSFDATLAQIGPSLGVPAGTRFELIDGGGDQVIVSAGWGPNGSWGSIAVDPIAHLGTEYYNCAQIINCTEVTGADGSMTYVAGPIVAQPVPITPSPGASPGQQSTERGYIPSDVSWSFHPDGTLVLLAVEAEHAPATLTIDQLVAAGLAFSLTQ